MPELPDVEGFRRYLARHAEGQRIVHVHVPDRAIVRNRSPQALGRSLRGASFASPTRHGKWLIAPVNRDHDARAEVLMHFGMTGLLSWAGDDDDRQPHDDDRHPHAERQPHDDDRHPQDRHPYDRLIFVCERGELRYNNMRRFGGVWLARDRTERDQVTGPLGPDAAQLAREEFERLISARRGAIKAALMDQRLIAGVGNLLSDEILWRARVHPKKPVRDLTRERRQDLHNALHAAVSESIRYGRVPHGERWLTRVRDERDAKCPRCGTSLQRGTVAGRTAVWCPREQR